MKKLILSLLTIGGLLTITACNVKTQPQNLVFPATVVSSDPSEQQCLRNLPLYCDSRLLFIPDRNVYAIACGENYDDYHLQPMIDDLNTINNYLSQFYSTTTNISFTLGEIDMAEELHVGASYSSDLLITLDDVNARAVEQMDGTGNPIEDTQGIYHWGSRTYITAPDAATLVTLFGDDSCIDLLQQ